MTAENKTAAPSHIGEAAGMVAPAQSGQARRFRHKTRGTTYTLIGNGRAQCSPCGLLDDEHVAIYQGDDGSLWARRYAEFWDGRFEEIAPAPGSPAEKGEGEAVWTAEREVGRAVYERVEKLVLQNPKPETSEWAELDYLSHLTDSVEEVGGYDGPLKPLYTHPASDQSDTESLDDAARRIFASEKPGAIYDHISANAKMSWMRRAWNARAALAEKEAGQ